MKKKIFVFLIIFASFLPFTYSASAITTEGTTGTNAGGLSTYWAVLGKDEGVLIVATNFANGSGIYVADITVIAIFFTNQTFRLRVYDSDMQSYIQPENELGKESKQRRFSVAPHIDINALTWIAEVTNEDGSILYGSIKLFYTYDPNADYTPVDPSGEYISVEEMEAQLRKVKIERFVGSSIMAGLGVAFAIFYIRRMK